MKTCSSKNGFVYPSIVRQRVKSKAKPQSLGWLGAVMVFCLTLMPMQSSLAGIANAGTNYTIDCGGAFGVGTRYLNNTTAYTVTVVNCPFSGLNAWSLGSITQTGPNVYAIAAGTVGTFYGRALVFDFPYVPSAISTQALLPTLLPGIQISRRTDTGVTTAVLNGQTYSVQPGPAIIKPVVLASAVIQNGSDGYLHILAPFRSNDSTDQALYPAFNEPATLRNVLLGLDANSTFTLLQDGSASIGFNQQTFVLVPDINLSAIPSNRVGQPWWQDGPTRFWVASQQQNIGMAQGFTVKQ